MPSDLLSADLWRSNMFHREDGKIKNCHASLLKVYFHRFLTSFSQTTKSLMTKKKSLSNLMAPIVLKISNDSAICINYYAISDLMTGIFR